MNFKSLFFIVSIISNCVTIPILIHFGIKHIKHLKSIDKISSRTVNKTGIHSILSMDSRSIVMLGNSLTERMPWTELFNNLNVKNRGIGGDRTESVLYRIHDITNKKPKKIFLMIGINDLIAKRDPSDIIVNYKKIVDTILNESPTTELLIQSVLPSNHNSSDHVQPEKVKKLNLLIKNIAEKNSLEYIDVYKLLIDKDGEIIDEYVTDGLHLNEKGYKIWSDLIYSKVIN